jgi:FlaA1/EpsC-like NDP-sugar epimerase
MQQVIIFGASQGGLNALEDIQYRLPHIHVLAFCDNDPKKHGKQLCGLPIIAPDALEQQPFDTLVIASSYAPEIWLQLYEMDFPMNRVEFIGHHILNR